MATGNRLIGKIVERIYGRDGEHETLYLRRVKLTPYTRWGQLLYHTFYRGDEDPDPHDHEWDFSTFPLGRRGYVEEVMDPVTGELSMNVVRGLRWTYRPATHCHRVVLYNGGVLRTIVWRRPRITGRTWGFWVPRAWSKSARWSELWRGGQRGSNQTRMKVHWRTYVFGTPQTGDSL